MKKQFRILTAALALCLSLLCCPAAFAAVDSSSCQTVPYAQATSQPLGQPITITGTPNYSAATSNDTAFIFGFDTADGVWYVAVQKSKFDAFKAAAPAQQMTLYGVYAGTLDVNGRRKLFRAVSRLCTRQEKASGRITFSIVAMRRNGTTSDTTALYTAGQKKLDAQKAAAAASSKKTTTTSGSKSTASSKKSTGSASSGQTTSQMVWIPTHGGKKYHSNPNCSGMKGPEKVSLSSAKSRGFTACKKCY